MKYKISKKAKDYLEAQASKWQDPNDINRLINDILGTLLDIKGYLNCIDSQNRRWTNYIYDKDKRED